MWTLAIGTMSKASRAAEGGTGAGMIFQRRARPYFGCLGRAAVVAIGLGAIAIGAASAAPVEDTISGRSAAWLSRPQKSASARA